MKTVDIAIVGATGAVGESVVDLLPAHDLPINQLYLLASSRTAGTSLMFSGSPVMVAELDGFDFSLVDIAIFVATDKVSSDYLPQAQAKGCIVIDNSQIFADSAPLIIPSVNGQLLAGQPSVIVNPDSNALMLVTVLHAVQTLSAIEKAFVSTYQSVSGAGKKAINELASQTASLLNGRGAEPSFYRQQIAFNVLPYVGEVGSDGYTVSERCLIDQTRRLLGHEDLIIDAACVQVPVFYADSMMVNIQTRESISLDDFSAVLAAHPELRVVDDVSKQEYATPVTNSTGSDHILLSRIRHDRHNECGLTFWLTADNVRKNAALNTILIAKELIKHRL